MSCFRGDSHWIEHRWAQSWATDLGQETSGCKVVWVNRWFVCYDEQIILGACFPLAIQLLTSNLNIRYLNTDPWISSWDANQCVPSSCSFLYSSQLSVFCFFQGPPLTVANWSVGSSTRLVRTRRGDSPTNQHVQWPSESSGWTPVACDTTSVEFDDCPCWNYRFIAEPHCQKLQTWSLVSVWLQDNPWTPKLQWKFRTHTVTIEPAGLRSRDPVPVDLFYHASHHTFNWSESDLIWTRRNIALPAPERRPPEGAAATVKGWSSDLHTTEPCPSSENGQVSDPF